MRIDFSKEKTLKKLKELKRIIIIVVILLLFNFYFAWKYFNARKALSQTLSFSSNLNQNVFNFTKFFIENVIKTDREVSLETRLKMENDVRNLNDKEILEKWEKFVNSKTEDEAQKNVRELLLILVEKIKR
jgi:cell shape-determining protein MreC